MCSVLRTALDEIFRHVDTLDGDPWPRVRELAASGDQSLAQAALERYLDEHDWSTGGPMGWSGPRCMTQTGKPADLLSCIYVGSPPAIPLPCHPAKLHICRLALLSLRSAAPVLSPPDPGPIDRRPSSHPAVCPECEPISGVARGASRRRLNTARGQTPRVPGRDGWMWPRSLRPHPSIICVRVVQQLMMR